MILINKKHTVKNWVGVLLFLILIVLSATISGVSIMSFTSTIGKSVGIVSASFTLIFSLTTGIIKKLLNITINKKKKHDQLLMLAGNLIVLKH